MKPFFCTSVLSTWISLRISWRCIARDYRRKYLTWLDGKSICASSWSFHPPTTLERVLTWSPRSKHIRARVSNWESCLSTSLTWVTRSNAHFFVFFLESSSQFDLVNPDQAIDLIVPGCFKLDPEGWPGEPRPTYFPTYPFRALIFGTRPLARVVASPPLSDLTWLNQINSLISSWPSKVSAWAAKRNLGMADLILCTSCCASPSVWQRIWPWRNIRSIPRKS